jgi:hypothetical protein
VPTVFRVSGHRFFFFSKDLDEPPHVHVETGENYAKFWLNPVALADSAGYDARELRQIRRIVESMRCMFLEKWYEHVSRS